MKPRLLFVDDDDANRLTFGALLEEAGFEVQEAQSLHQARQQLSNGPWNVVLLDVQLKDGRGPDLLPEIRARHPNAALAILSGNGNDVAHSVELTLRKGASPAETIEQVCTLWSRRDREVPK
jgi:DNA-binding NtrC family response regulator